jgi:hypothetical protein
MAYSFFNSNNFSCRKTGGFASTGRYRVQNLLPCGYLIHNSSAFSNINTAWLRENLHKIDLVSTFICPVLLLWNFTMNWKVVKLLAKMVRKYRNFTFNLQYSTPPWYIFFNVNEFTYLSYLLILSLFFWGSSQDSQQSRTGKKQKRILSTQAKKIKILFFKGKSLLLSFCTVKQARKRRGWEGGEKRGGRLWVWGREQCYAWLEVTKREKPRKASKRKHNTLLCI